MLSGLGTTEFIVIGIALVVLFGGRKLPELAKGVADAIREFRKAAGDPV